MSGMTSRVRPAASVSSVSGDGPKNPAPTDMRLVHSPDRNSADTRGLKIGATVAIEAIDDVYYFSHLGAMDRARLFWRRTGRAGDRVNAIARSLSKRVWKSPFVSKGP